MSAHPPQHNIIDFKHLGNNIAQTMYSIFIHSYNLSLDQITFYIQPYKVI